MQKYGKEKNENVHVRDAWRKIKTTFTTEF